MPRPKVGSIEFSLSHCSMMDSVFYTERALSTTPQQLRAPLTSNVDTAKKLIIIEQVIWQCTTYIIKKALKR